MVTSGDYQRYFIGSDGQRYHHIINPATGYSSESGLISATVVADSSMVADALSTALFVAGLHQGISLLGTVPGIEAILITADLRV
ncbi:MAG TPA: FAD:protein FMN transferase, partial [Firmicutes bacterium]|nr:FAD:protein FMN transferase [Bacillota bacterium]